MRIRICNHLFGYGGGVPDRFPAGVNVSPLLRKLFSAGNVILLWAMLVMSACATTHSAPQELPPILKQDELFRPYVKVGILEVSRERFGTADNLSDRDYEWAYRRLREEALKIGADAVIFPEVRGELRSYILFPSSDIKAKGVAVKFR